MPQPAPYTIYPLGQANPWASLRGVTAVTTTSGDTNSYGINPYSTGYINPSPQWIIQGTGTNP
jgi:hypothetical protein